jgi:ADP-ribosylglycohydrolase
MKTTRDRVLGAYIGAAIGDAMGGPIECSHAARIRRVVGEITGLLPYQASYRMVPKLGPGYALHEAAGSVTDDTFIRADFTRFFLETVAPRTPRMLADWLSAHANFDWWWPPIVEGLRRVERGEVTPEEGGDTFLQGGGIGWWTPVGILHAADPAGADAEASDLCRIWKAPLERDLLGAVQAGLAEGLRVGATADSVVEVVLGHCGPLATRLLERAIDLARQATSVPDLVDRLYRHVLMPPLAFDGGPEPPREVDAPLPPVIEPVDDSDGFYTTCYFAEQIPLSMAGFVYARGEPDAIRVTAMLGRDADSTSTTVGSWVGALCGESGLPTDWVAPVCRVNMDEIDIRALAERLADVVVRDDG